MNCIACNKEIPFCEDICNSPVCKAKQQAYDKELLQRFEEVKIELRKKHKLYEYKEQ